MQMWHEVASPVVIPSCDVMKVISSSISTCPQESYRKKDAYLSSLKVQQDSLQTFTNTHVVLIKSLMDQ